MQNIAVSASLFFAFDLYEIYVPNLRHESFLPYPLHHVTLTIFMALSFKPSRPFSSDNPHDTFTLTTLKTLFLAQSYDTFLMTTPMTLSL